MAAVVFIFLFFTLLGRSLSDVVISQVVTGSSYNKALVVTNRGSNPADLSSYSLKISFNQQPWETVRAPLANSLLGSGKSFSLCHTRFSEPYKELCNSFDNSINYNGDDAIALVLDGKLVDVFGEEKGAGLDGAKGYTIAGVKTASRLHTLLREKSVTRGTTDWKVGVTQWEVLPKDVFVKEDGTTVQVVSTPSPKQSPEGPEPQEPSPVSPASPPVVSGSGVRMGSFNVEFLFDGIDDPEPSPYVGKPDKAEQHFRRVRDIIKSLEVDFLHLCEVESRDILDRMAREVGGLKGHFVQGTDRFTGQDVALLSKIDPVEMYRSRGRADTPIPDSACGTRSTGNTGISKNYVAKFDRSRYFPFKFAMVGLHLKAFPVDEKSCSQREGQAEVVQGIVSDLISEGYEVAVLGDLNDFSEKTADVKGDKPRSRVLAMLRDPDGNGREELRNVMELIPKKDRYSAWWDKDRDGRLDGPRELSQIDHILLTKGLWELVDRAWVDHRAAAGSVSDHWPVMVEFRSEGKRDFNNGASWTPSGFIAILAVISGVLVLLGLG